MLSCQNNLEKSSEVPAEEIMKEAAKRLYKKVLEEEPEICEVDQKGRMFPNVAVTVNGTWQKWGHSSKMGVVSVISVLTGELVDFQVRSLICHGCQQKSTNIVKYTRTGWLLIKRLVVILRAHQVKWRYKVQVISSQGQVNIEI